MYNVYIPVMSSKLARMGIDECINQVKRAEADRVFLIFEKKNTAEALNKEIEILKYNINYFAKAGIKTAVWLDSTIGHGGALEHQQLSDDNDLFSKYVDFSGKVYANTYCPLDDKFTDYVCDILKKIAQIGVDIIMLDDDFRLSCRGGEMGCACNEHIKRFNSFINDDLDREQIKNYIFSGKSNKYRSVWLDVAGKSLEKMAKKMRDMIDTVNPEIRLGLCASPSMWGIDGTDSITVAKILAGKTKPLLRLIGAPYWTRNSSHLAVQNAVEYERLQSHWCCDEGIELIAEGDVYPRPRYNVPSAYLEAFDTAIRSDGTINSIMKYMLDYTSSAEYETGYIDVHIRNKEFYVKISEMFTGKKSVGVNVFENINLFKNCILPEDKYIGDSYAWNMSSAALRFLCHNSIPITYDGNGTSIMFGANAAFYKKLDLKKGVIIDGYAAAMLTDAGVDCGLNKISISAFKPSEEYYIKENEYISINTDSFFYETELNENANLLSEFIRYNGETTEKVNASYLYENTNKERFLVYLFNAYDVSIQNNSLYRSYARQREMVNSLRWLGGKQDYAICLGHPDLYIVCKADNNSLAVGLWNNFADTVYLPQIMLGETYRKIEIINGDATIKGNTVQYNTDIVPFSFSGFVVYK